MDHSQTVQNSTTMNIAQEDREMAKAKKQQEDREIRAKLTISSDEKFEKKGAIVLVDMVTK